MAVMEGRLVTLWTGPVGYGFCVPGCATDDHGRCTDWSCACERDVCVDSRERFDPGPLEHEFRGGLGPLVWPDLVAVAFIALCIGFFLGWLVFGG